MLVNNFPLVSGDSPGNVLFPDKTKIPFGRNNIIINARTESIMYMPHSAPLSIKFTLKGKEIYEFEGAKLSVNNSNFLILNNGQTYSSYINSNSEVESFCFFFRDGLINDIVSSSKKVFVEDGNESQDVNFYEKLYKIRYPFASEFYLIIKSLKFGKISENRMEEIFYRLGEIILELNNVEIKNSFSLKYERTSTRREVYRRLLRCRDFITSNYCENITLDDISKACCISKYYLIKVFKQYYLETPYQFLTSCRLEKAKYLIENSDIKIGQIVLLLGFENMSSFSRLFKSKYGKNPTTFRRKLTL